VVGGLLCVCPLIRPETQKHSLIRAPPISAIFFSKKGGRHIRYFGKQDSAVKVKEPK
jgi:hypothetical protein